MEVDVVDARRAHDQRREVLGELEGEETNAAVPSRHGQRWCPASTRSSARWTEASGSHQLAAELDRLDLIDDYRFLVHPRIAGHGPTLYQIARRSRGARSPGRRPLLTGVQREVAVAVRRGHRRVTVDPPRRTP